MTSGELTEVKKQLFPYAQHQLCLLHLQRNLKAKLPSRTYRKVRSLFAKLRVAYDRQEGEKLLGEKLFAELCQVVKEEYLTVAKALKKKPLITWLSWITPKRFANISTPPIP